MLYIMGWVNMGSSEEKKSQVKKDKFRLSLILSLKKLGHTNFVVTMLSVTDHIYNHILVESSTVFSGNTANMNNSLGICKKKQV